MNGQDRLIGTPSGLFVRYLTRTHPAAIFIHAVGVLLLAPFLVAMEYWLQASYGGYGDMLRMTLAGSDDIRFSISDDAPVNPLRSALVWMLRIIGRVFVIVGYALPVWAAARLIADTLRDKPQAPAPPAA